MDLLTPTDWLVFLLVVGLRFLLPLFIPFFPLPAIIACLLLDGVDQTLFQVFTDLPLDGYQSYDKALDIYYLTVAYISTFRNWTHDFAFRVSRFLFYYRMVGVVLFELLGNRALLLIFPNTFEYFFIWYEAVRLWWNPRRLTRRAVLTAAAAIWIVIKLPQEYWIHIAQRDVTDTIKALLGGAPEDAWGPLITANLLLILAVLAVLVVGAWLLYRTLRRRLPAPEYPMAWRADDQAEPIPAGRLSEARRAWMARIFDRDLFEKAALMTLLTIIFAEMLPTSTMTPGRVAVLVTGFVVANTVIGHVAARRTMARRAALGEELGPVIASGAAHFAVVLAINVALMALRGVVLGGATNWFNATLFVLLLSLIVTLFDRFQPFYLAREGVR